MRREVAVDEASGVQMCEAERGARHVEADRAVVEVATLRIVRRKAAAREQRRHENDLLLMPERPVQALDEVIARRVREAGQLRPGALTEVRPGLGIGCRHWHALQREEAARRIELRRDVRRPEPAVVDLRVHVEVGGDHRDAPRVEVLQQLLVLRRREVSRHEPAVHEAQQRHLLRIVELIARHGEALAAQALLDGVHQHVAAADEPPHGLVHVHLDLLALVLQHELMEALFLRTPAEVGHEGKVPHQVAGHVDGLVVVEEDAHDAVRLIAHEHVVVPELEALAQEHERRDGPARPVIVAGLPLHESQEVYEAQRRRQHVDDVPKPGLRLALLVEPFAERLLIGNVKEIGPLCHAGQRRGELVATAVAIVLGARSDGVALGELAQLAALIVSGPRGRSPDSSCLRRRVRKAGPARNAPHVPQTQQRRAKVRGGFSAVVSASGANPVLWPWCCAASTPWRGGSVAANIQVFGDKSEGLSWRFSSVA
mmetsp:Transcript_23832/g.74986  ORF Transcript_23832/g.74986 Transcript_23832/m.74986 type:complete len:485 (+) Transcript_23832:2854-4308(+)